MATGRKDKTTHLALLLPLIGTFLLMPPAVLVFDLPINLGGIPLIVVYLFAIWGFLITGALILARQLSPKAESIASDREVKDIEPPR